VLKSFYVCVCTQCVCVCVCFQEIGDNMCVRVCMSVLVHAYVSLSLCVSVRTRSGGR
jgi:hypothetical protein